MPESPAKRIRRFRVRANDVLLIVAMLVVSAVVWTLVDSNQTLRLQIRTMQEVRGLAMTEGDPIPAVRVVDNAGAPALLSDLVPTGRPAIIVFLTSTCDYCGDMMPFWKETANRALEEDIRFLGVLLGSNQQQQSFASVPWPLYAAETVEERRALAVPVVPLTVVVDRSGNVARLWRGAQPMRVVRDVLDRASGVPAVVSQ